MASPEIILSLRHDPEKAFTAMYSVLSDISGQLSEIKISSAIHSERMTQVAKDIQRLDGRTTMIEQKVGVIETDKQQNVGSRKTLSMMAGGAGAMGAAVAWLFEHWPK